LSHLFNKRLFEVVHIIISAMRYAVVTCEIELFWNYIRVYFTCDHRRWWLHVQKHWNNFKIISAF